MAQQAVNQYRKASTVRRVASFAAALAAVAIATIAIQASPVSAQMPMPMGNPMAGPMMGGMFGGTMAAPIFPSSFGMGIPSYSMPVNNYQSIYAAPISNTVVSSSNAYSGTTSYSAQPAYSYSGQYCTDQSGGQIWVPTGGASDGLNCNGASANSGSSSGAANSSGSSSGYTP